MTSKLNVILDIDETLVQYLGPKNKITVDEDELSKYDSHTTKSGKMFLLRPRVQEFLDTLFEKYNVSLWTFSGKEYALGVANFLVYGKDSNGVPKYPKRKLKFILSSIDDNNNAEISHTGENWAYGNAASEHHGNAKDLNHLWYARDKDGKYIPNPAYPNLRECNTVLIDDNPKNVMNPSNHKNAIKIQKFEVESGDFTIDTVFDQCLEILEKAQTILSRPDLDEEVNVFQHPEFSQYKQGKPLSAVTTQNVKVQTAGKTSKSTSKLIRKSLDKCTVAELRTKALKRKIRNCTGMCKSELLTALRNKNKYTHS